MRQEKSETGIASFGRKLGARIGINRQQPSSNYLVRSESFYVSYSPSSVRKTTPASNKNKNKVTSSNNKTCNDDVKDLNGNDKFISKTKKNDLSVVHEEIVFPPY